jgi:hypothetical protein
LAGGDGDQFRELLDQLALTGGKSVSNGDLDRIKRV